MSQQIVKAYRIPQLRVENPIGLYFEGVNEYDKFWRTWPDQTELSNYALEHNMNYVRNRWDYLNSITVYDNALNRIPYNYIRIGVPGEQNYAYYITGWEELGAGQIRYTLKMDTIQTYMYSPYSNLRLQHKPQLVLREHKDRWEPNLTPIIDRTIEEIDITPDYTEVTQVAHNGSTGRIRLALTHKKVSDNNSSYIWELYTENSININNQEGISVFGEGGMAFTGSNIEFKYGDSTLIMNVPTNYHARLNTSSAAQGDKFIIYFYVNSSGGRRMVNISPSEATVTSGDSIRVAGHYIVFSKDNEHNIRVNLSTAGDKIYIDGPTNAEEQLTPLDDLEEYGEVIFGNIPTKTFDQLDVTDPIYSQIKELPIKPSFIGDQKPKFNGRHWYFEANQSLSINSFNDNMRITLPSLSSLLDRSGVHQLKIPNNDPKLYHSQFRPMLFTWYDSVINFKMERLTSPTVQMEYKLFYDQADFGKAKIEYNSSGQYDHETPYDLTTVINLDNTVAQMSSERDTYNRYLIDNELKSLEIQKQQNSRSQAQSMLNAMVNILPTSTFDKPDSLLQSGVRTVRGLLNFGFEYANQVDRQKQLDLTYQMKMDRLKISTINISGSGTNLNRLDDSDRIRVWTGKLLPANLEYVDNYFHHFGYKTLEFKPIPTLKKRKLWSHWKIIIDPTHLFGHVSEEVALDIAQRFKDGITLFHEMYDENDEPLVYFHQAYENWEVWL